MGRLIDVDNIEYYLEEGGTVVAFKADIEQIPSAQPDKEALDDAYAHGYTYAESKYRAMMSDGDCISRQAAIDALEKVAELFPWRVPGKSDTYDSYNEAWNDAIGRAEMEIESLPSAQPEPHYCRECKWSRCHINVDKHGKSETYWRCLNWDGGTDEEGYCYEWERRTDGQTD